MKITSVLLASGGLDSTTLAYWLKAKNINFCPLFVDYGQHCAKTEWETLQQVLPLDYLPFTEKISLLDIYKGNSSRLIREANLWEEVVEDSDFYLPYRNLLLLTVGAAFAHSRGYLNLYAAFINSNHTREVDSSTGFLNELGELLIKYGGVKVKTPFRKLTKFEVANIGISLQAPIGRTFSCHASSDVPCGACPNCVDRLEALELLG